MKTSPKDTINFPRNLNQDSLNKIIDTARRNTGKQFVYQIISGNYISHNLRGNIIIGDKCLQWERDTLVFTIQHELYMSEMRYLNYLFDLSLGASMVFLLMSPFDILLRLAAIIIHSFLIAYLRKFYHGVLEKISDRRSFFATKSKKKILKMFKKNIDDHQKNKALNNKSRLHNLEKIAHPS